MTVKELIEALESAPPARNLAGFDDGEPTLEVCRECGGCGWVEGYERLPWRVGKAEPCPACDGYGRVESGADTSEENVV